MRLFRQAERGQWAPLIRQVADEFRRLPPPSRPVGNYLSEWAKVLEKTADRLSGLVPLSS